VHSYIWFWYTTHIIREKFNCGNDRHYVEGAFLSGKAQLLLEK